MRMTKEIKKEFPMTPGMKWLIKNVTTVQYAMTETGWKVYNKETKKVIATGKTLNSCLELAAKKDQKSKH